MKPRLLAIILVLCLTMSVTALADNSSATNITEVRYSESISLNAGEYISTVGESEEDTLVGLIVTAVPADFKGSISNGLRDISNGDALLAKDIENLSFNPLAEGDMQAVFEYIPVYSVSGLGTRDSISLSVINRPNVAPVASDVSVETYKNVAISSLFLAEDADGDELTFAITGEPKRGTVEVLSSGKFIYTPNKNKVGKDKFTYTVTDVEGNVSEAATVNVQIKKTAKKISYSDMEGNDSYYAALRLAEEDIFVGEQLGNEHYFMPEKTVNRGEFLAMALKAVGLEGSDLGTSSGFADEEETPVWVRPYITTGLKTGIISGVATSGDGLVFRSDATLTRAEAVVIINNALGIGNAESVLAATTDDAVPAWAHQATVNLESYGLLKVDDTGSYQLSKEVTRAEAAELISAAMDIIENREVSKSLLSWVLD